MTSFSSTNAFSLYHDYTEVRPGTDKYVNVVRTGSKASNPSAYILDTGEVLRHETLKGDAITAAKIDAGTVTPETEVVVVHFPPVKEGQSIRLRISETYTHPESYRLEWQKYDFSFVALAGIEWKANMDLFETLKRDYPHIPILEVRYEAFCAAAGPACR